MNTVLVSRPTRFAIEEITEEDREVAACTVQLEQLKRERANAKGGHHRAILDAAMQNVRSQLEYAVERRRVKADIRRYESEQRIRA